MSNVEAVMSHLEAGKDEAVLRIERERQKVIDLLKPVKDDPRADQFLVEYEANYEKLMISESNREKMLKEVRTLKANRDVSTARSRAVEDIYRQTDENVANLKREVNIVYHQLIELQEEEDKSRADVGGLVRQVRDMKDLIKEREQAIPQNKVRLKGKMEEKLHDMKDERDKAVREVDHLKEGFWDAGTLQTRLELQRIRIEDKTEQTKGDSSRVGNEINKESEKRSRVKSALQATKDKMEVRQQDMEDLQKEVENTSQECRLITDKTRAVVISAEKINMDLKSLSSKLRTKNFVYGAQMDCVQKLQAEVDFLTPEYKRRKQETDALKDQNVHLDKVKTLIRQKTNDFDSRKSKIMTKKEKEKKINTALIEELCETKRNFERNVKLQTAYLRERDFLRKHLMRQRATMSKNRMLYNLHQLASKRLTQDNTQLVGQGEDQKRVMKKLEAERNNYLKQAVTTMKKGMKVSEKERRSMDVVFYYMRLIAEEEMTMMEMQNMYESTRNEHVIYNRHILQLKDLTTNLKAKTMAMQYEAQKLVQERDYRDECILHETMASQKLSRQIFILKVNLKDLKESNTRTKVIIENQDMEEKKMIKITRVMKQERIREVKGLELVIRDVDGLDLALTRRHHELHDLYEHVKLRQSLLEKGENMYNIRFKEHTTLTANLRHTRDLRKVDQKYRNILDNLQDCVKFLHGEIEKVHLRSKRLSEELSHPRNIHRWRNLLSRDPESYESIGSMRRLRRQIQEKVDLTTETTTKIHLLDREYILHTTRVLMQPSPETVMQLKIYKQDLNTRFVQLKRLTIEMTTLLDDKTDGTARTKAIQHKMQMIGDLWLKLMAKEKKQAQQERMKVSGPLSLLLGPSGTSQISGGSESMVVPTKLISPRFGKGGK